MAADIVKADVLAIAPDLSMTDGAWTDILAYVNELDLTPLGESAQVTRMAKMYLAAHFGTLGQQATTGGGAAVSGPVTSESAGGLRRTYATTGDGTTVSSTDLGSTMFGQLYMRIIGMSGARGPMVI